VELKHLVDTIAAGNSSATGMAAINEREAPEATFLAMLPRRA
jgi:hypothetical protein